MGLEVGATALEDVSEIVAEAELVGVAADDPGAPVVGFPSIEHGSEVDERDVVRFDDPVRRVSRIGEQRVGAGSHDPLVPVALHPEQVSGKFGDGVGGFGLAHPRPDDPSGFDRCEQLPRPLLGNEQLPCPVLLVDALCHPPSVCRDRQGPVP